MKNKLFMRLRRPIFAAAVLCASSSSAAESFLLYHEGLARSEELQTIRSASEQRFAALKESIEESRNNFKNDKLPPLVRERMGKRFQICDRLLGLIGNYSRNTQPESTFHVMRMLNDLEIFDQYFKDELAHGKAVLAHPETKRFSVKDFGAKGDGVADDTEAVEAALAAIRALKGAPAELVFPKGKYRFQKLMNAESTRNLFGEKPLPCADVAKKHSNNHYYTKYVHFLLCDLDNLTVRGETGDTELLFTQPEIGVLLAACSNVTLKNLTLRSLSPTHTQGVLEAVDPQNKTLTVRFDEGRPLPDDPGWSLVRNSTAQSYDDNGTIVKAASDILSANLWEYEKLGDRLYKVKYSAARYRDKIPVGVRIAFPIRQDRQSMITSKRCRFTTFDNLTIVNSGASAMPTAESYVTSFINCRVLPADGNLMSSAADGSINIDNFFGPYYRGCVFRNIGDDGINVFGYAGHVLENNGNVFKVDAHHFWGGEPIAPGETLVLKKKVPAVIIDSNTGKIKGVARVVSVKSVPEHGKPVCEIVLDGPIAHDAIVSAKKLAPDKTWIEYVDYVGKESERRRLAMQGGTTFLKPDHIAFPTECGIGTVVTGCEISNNRHNGITLQSGNALIENNKIGGNTDFGILITSYYRGLGGWREGGLPYNVVIRRNTIHDAFIALSLWYSTGIGKYSPLIAFRDILFEENICKNIVRGIDIYNVNGLCLRRNVFEGVNMARSDVSRNVYCENNLWNGERFSPLHFTKTAQDSSVYAFRTTDPKFEGKSPTVNQRNLSHYEWSKEKDCVKVALRKEGLAVEVLKQPADDKIHPAFTQVGYLFPGLWEGTYQLTCKVVSSHDVQILAISEIVHKKKFAEQKLDLKANEPQEIKLVINIDKASALQATRLIYFCIAQAPAGTKFEFGIPVIEVVAKE